MQAWRLKYAVVLFLTLTVIVCLESFFFPTIAEGANTAIYPLPIKNNSTAISSIKRLPDGAPVYINDKVVISKFMGQVYIEEADRSAGIRVIPDTYFPPSDISPGNTISFSGIMGTYAGERAVIITSEPAYNALFLIQIGALGMSNPAILGYPAIPYEPNNFPCLKGLVPIGLRVRIWGTITETGLLDDDGWHMYLDDGSGKKDGVYPTITGIRVYSNNLPEPGSNIIVATGALSTKEIDPTPSLPDSGDEFIIPVIRVASDNDIFEPNFPYVVHQTDSVSGTVKLINQSAQGKTVRVYSQYSSVVLDNVTDAGTPFTLQKIPVDGGIISASASGYNSLTLDVNGGSTNLDLQLVPASAAYVDVKSDTNSILVCAGQNALISALLRDCEGKAILGKQIKFATTSGKFTESQSNQIILNVDDKGFAQAHLTPGPDASGTATVTAEAYPYVEGDYSSQVNVIFRSNTITLAANTYYLTGPGTSNITAHIADESVAIQNASITLNTDHGIFQENGLSTYSTTTDSNGNAQATLVISSPGTARVMATSTDACSNVIAAWLAVAYKTAPWVAQSVQYSNPLVVDLDGNPDGNKEVVVITSNGNLTALDSTGSTLWTYMMHDPGTNTPACAILDTERSGKPCIFVPADNQQSVYAFTHDGQTLAGWPVGTNFRFTYCSPAIGDINLDGSIEVVVADYSCFVFSWNPTGDWKKSGTSNSSFLWRNLTGTANTTISGSSCALGDLDNDPNKILDVAVGSTIPTQAFAFQGDLWGDFKDVPVYLSGWWKSVACGIESSPAIGDIDGDGKNDIAVGTKNKTETNDGSYMYVWLSGNDSWNSYAIDAESIYSSPALHDLDGDNKLDIIFGSDSGKLYAINWLGQAINGWKNGIRLNSSGVYAVKSSPIVGDVTGDGQVDVIVGCSDGNVYAIYKDGMNHHQGDIPTGPIAWIKCCIPPNKSSAHIYTAPAISLNNNGTIDVIAAGSEGIYKIALGNAYSLDPSLYPWPTFHRDNQRTGCVTASPQPVNASIQGIITRGGVPLPGVEVRIYYNENDSYGNPVPVPKPHSIPSAAREFILSVGNGIDTNEPGSGAYIINQLEPNMVYKIKTKDSLGVEQWFTDISVTTGMQRFDIPL